MAMSGFICHDDYYDRLKRLSNEEVGNLFRQLMLYHAGRYDEMTDFINSEGIAFDFISDDIDRMEKKANETSETNRLNGLKGGRPKKQKEPENTEENPIKPNESEKEAKETEQKANKDKDKDKEKHKESTSMFFDEFWNAYPRHSGKQAAMKAFDKARIDNKLLQTILTAIERQKQSPQWVKDDGQFIPYPATWLNQKRWEDEEQPCLQKKVTAQGYEQRDYSTVQDEILRKQEQYVLERLANGA